MSVNPRVVTAIFESYLNVRKDLWKMHDTATDKVTVPDSPKPKHKIETCIDFIQKANRENLDSNWIEMMYELAAKEEQEKDNQHYGFIAFFLDRPLLLETMRAVRGYIALNIRSTQTFTDSKELLQLDISRLEREIAADMKANLTKELIENKQVLLSDKQKKLAVLNDTADYHHSYFLDVTKGRDAKSVELQEQSFEDFERNAVARKRSLGLYEKIMNENVGKTAEVLAPSSASEPSGSLSTLVFTQSMLDSNEKPKDTPKQPESVSLLDAPNPDSGTSSAPKTTYAAVASVLSAPKSSSKQKAQRVDHLPPPPDGPLVSVDPFAPRTVTVNLSQGVRRRRKTGERSDANTDFTQNTRYNR